MAVLTYAALFYFPDNFANFYDAMWTPAGNSRLAGVCAEEATITAGLQRTRHTRLQRERGRLRSADGRHAVLQQQRPGMRHRHQPLIPLFPPPYTPKATRIFTPYRFSSGDFTAVLTLPASGSNYLVYAMGLFDSARNHITDVAASASNSSNGNCPLNGECLTNDQVLVLSQNIASAGRYYLVVTGGEAIFQRSHTR